MQIANYQKADVSFEMKNGEVIETTVIDYCPLGSRMAAFMTHESAVNLAIKKERIRCENVVNISVRHAE